MTRLLAGLDLGSTHIKGVIVDPVDRKVIRGKECPLPRLTDPASGRDEIDPQAALHASRELLSELGIQKGDLVFVTGQMHGALLVDSQGKPLGPFFGWQDRRASAEAAETGLRAGYTLPLLLYLRKQMPTEWRRLACVVSLCDFVARALNEEVQRPIWKTHITLAAATGAFSLKDLRWNQSLLNQAGLDASQFPDVSLRAGPGIAVGDQQATLFGLGLGVRSDTAVNVGTGSQVIRLLGTELPPQSENFEVRPYFGKRWIATVPGLPGGKILEPSHAQLFVEALARLPKAPANLPGHQLLAAGKVLRRNAEIRAAFEKALGPLTFADEEGEAPRGAALCGFGEF